MCVCVYIYMCVCVAIKHFLFFHIYIYGDGSIPRVVAGPHPTPPLLQTLVAPALFQTFKVRNYYMMDLVAPALSQKPIFATNFVARGAPALLQSRRF